jgi:hypothetical protein
VKKRSLALRVGEEKSLWLALRVGLRKSHSLALRVGEEKNPRAYAHGSPVLIWGAWLETSLAWRCSAGEKRKRPGNCLAFRNTVSGPEWFNTRGGEASANSEGRTQKAENQEHFRFWWRWFER